MTPTQPVRAKRARSVVACLATLALGLAACSGANPSTSPSASVSSIGAEQPASRAPSASQAPASRAPSASQALSSQVASVRCASTPNATPIATVKWNRMVEGSPTIKAGQAVAFITQSDVGPTVTEGTNGTPAADACIDKVLIQRSALVVTFYKPGVYNLFCRKAPSIMLTTVHVK